jgi:FdhD protein
MDENIYAEIECIRVNGESTHVTERIIRETALTILIDNQHVATAMIVAAMAKEYVTGYLYIQGYIHRVSDILSIKIENNIAGVKLKPGIEKRALPQTVHSDLKIRNEDVINCVSAILTSPIFEETGAVHSAGLFLDGKEAVAIAEDLGRHNALDKAIGAGLLKDVDFSKTLATSTGRQPTEMILKCISAGIPIIATKGVPTSLGVELAEKAGITIVGLVRKNSMIVYSHPERIE